MKKNKLFLLGLFVVFAAVLSLSLVSNTLAKYTTNGTSSDSARVAKWGVTVTAPNADTLFAENYGESVQSFDHEDVVAPGTNGVLADFTITGSPEVDVMVTYSAVLTLSNWKVGDPATEYCPIIITVEGEDYYIGKTGIENIAQLKTEVENAIAAVSQGYNYNSSISDTLEVSWRWELNQNLVPSQTDEQDTKLGDLATAPTIELSVTCTVTQVA